MITFQDNLVHNNQMKRVTVVVKISPRLEIDSITTTNETIDINELSENEVQRLVLVGRKYYIKEKLK